MKKFFIFLTSFLLFLNFLNAKEFYKRELPENKKNVFNQELVLKRDYPGGVDEEDLQIIKLKEPKSKITKKSLERKALQNLKASQSQ